MEEEESSGGQIFLSAEIPGGRQHFHLGVHSGE